MNVPHQVKKKEKLIYMKSSIRQNSVCGQGTLIHSWITLVTRTHVRLRKDNQKFKERRRRYARHSCTNVESGICGNK